jgi:hypothetical protein
MLLTSILHKIFIPTSKLILNVLATTNHSTDYIIIDDGNEEKVAIQFYFKAGLSATETLVLVQMVKMVQMPYGKKALNRSMLLTGIHNFETERSW